MHRLQPRLRQTVVHLNRRLEPEVPLSVRNERGESRREGPSKKEIPPLRPPASGREGEKAGRRRGSGMQGAHKVRGVLSLVAGLMLQANITARSAEPRPQTEYKTAIHA